MHFFYLFFAVVAEVVATSALKLSEGFTRLYPSMVVVVGYGVAFYLLSLSLKVFPLSVAYATWCGLGIVLVALVQIFWFRSGIDLPGAIGLALIVAGVVIVNAWSKMAAH